jgi:hypothetical protein
MGITGQISLARVGRSVQIFERASDLIDVFDQNVSPTLEPNDHITLYPGDFRDVLKNNSIDIPNDIFVTILPGALVGYDTISGPLQDRYRYITGAIENISDLNIANQYTTETERQLSRIRIYPDEVNPTTSFEEVDDLDKAAEIVETGETVVVFPGVYEPSRNLYVEGTTWKFLDGAIVRYNPEFEETSSGTYPHALFDDLKDIDGVDDPGGKDVEVYGKGEFQVGTSTPQPLNLPSDYGTGSELFDDATTSDIDWKAWNLYSILAVNNSSSSATFEARKVEMTEYADAAFKLSASNDVDINIEEGTIRSDIQDDSDVPTSLTPSFVVVNGVPLTSSGTPSIDVNVSDFLIESGVSPNLRFAVGINHNPDPESTNDIPNERNPFTGDLNFEVQEAVSNTDQTGSQFIRIANLSSPSTLFVDNTHTGSNNGPILLNGSTVNTTKFVIKESALETSGGQAPVELDGDPAGFDANIHNTFLLTNETVDFDLAAISTFSVSNFTGSVDFEVKIYGDSFGDAPIEDFREILHPELNNFSWSSDVEALSF